MTRSAKEVEGGKERQRNNIKVCICMSVLDGLNQSERERAKMVCGMVY